MYLVILYKAISIEGDLMILPTNILLDLVIFINIGMISATTNQLKLMIIFIKLDHMILTIPNQLNSIVMLSSFPFVYREMLVDKKGHFLETRVMNIKVSLVFF